MLLGALTASTCTILFSRRLLEFSQTQQKAYYEPIILSFWRLITIKVVHNIDGAWDFFRAGMSHPRKILASDASSLESFSTCDSASLCAILFFFCVCVCISMRVCFSNKNIRKRAECEHQPRLWFLCCYAGLPGMKTSMPAQASAGVLIPVKPQHFAVIAFGWRGGRFHSGTLVPE